MLLGPEEHGSIDLTTAVGALQVTSVGQSSDYGHGHDREIFQLSVSQPGDFRSCGLARGCGDPSIFAGGDWNGAAEFQGRRCSSER